MGEDSEDNLSTMDEDILEDNSSMDEDKLKDNSLTDEDEYKCCHCNKLKSQLEYSELPKLEALDFKAVMESISTHLLEAWKSSDSDSEHLMYLIYYFSLKSDHYLYDREYIFSAEKLEAMFRLFEVFVKCQGDFTRLNPNHLDGSKLALLAQQASLLRCYEARGFLENVEDLGMRVLNTAGEDKLLTESDLHMHLTAIYSIMVNVAKSNTNDDRYLRDLLPFVIVKEANELFRSDKEWVGALLCLITKWAHALLKKAKSSDIGSNVASLCWSTLAFLMDSHFNDNESLFRGDTFFPTTGRSVATMKDMTLPNSILKLCVVGLRFSRRDSFEKLLQTLEDNMVLLETVSSSRASMSMTVQDKNCLTKIVSQMHYFLCIYLCVNQSILAVAGSI